MAGAIHKGPEEDGENSLSPFFAEDLAADIGSAWVVGSEEQNCHTQMVVARFAVDYVTELVHFR